MTKAKDLLLPLGSVVRLKKGTALLIIQGYMPNDLRNNNKIYDYEGNIFPTGRQGENVILFNVEDIDEVLFVGYQTDASIKYRETISKVRENLKKGMTIEEAVQKAIN